LVDVEKTVETIQSFTEQQRAEMLPNHLGMSSRFVVSGSPGAATARRRYFEGWEVGVCRQRLDDSVTVIDVAGAAWTA
jgi:hypothetical protein